MKVNRESGGYGFIYHFFFLNKNYLNLIQVEFSVRGFYLTRPHMFLQVGMFPIWL